MGSIVSRQYSWTQSLVGYATALVFVSNVTVLVFCLVEAFFKTRSRRKNKILLNCLTVETTTAMTGQFIGTRCPPIALWYIYIYIYIYVNEWEVDGRYAH